MKSPVRVVIPGSGGHLLELYSHLYQRNLSHSPKLKTDLRSIISQIPESWILALGDEPLRKAAMPFVFRIPRVNLGPLVKYVNDCKGTPHEAVLQIQLNHENGAHTFTSFEMAFGIFINAENITNRSIQIDNKGWNGEGDLFIFLYLPLAELFQPNISTISLNIGYNSTLAEPFACYFSVLGPDMLIFETEIADDLYFLPVANMESQFQFQNDIFRMDLAPLKKTVVKLRIPESTRPPKTS